MKTNTERALMGLAILVWTCCAATLLTAQSEQPEPDAPIAAELDVLARRTDRVLVDGSDYRIVVLVVRDAPSVVREALVRGCIGDLAVEGALAVCVAPGGALGPVHVVRGDGTGSVVRIVERLGERRGAASSGDVRHAAIAEGGLTWLERDHPGDAALAQEQAERERDGWARVGSANGVDRFVRGAQTMDVAVSDDTVTVWTSR
jgi:hypothetical protein